MFFGPRAIDDLAAQLDADFPHLKDVLLANGRLKVPNVTSRYAFKKKIGQRHCGEVWMAQELFTRKLFTVKTTRQVETDDYVSPKLHQTSSLLRLA